MDQEAANVGVVGAVGADGIDVETSTVAVTSPDRPNR